MRTFLFSLVGLALAVSASAAPSFDAGEWNRLVNKAANSEKRGQFGDAQLRYLERIAPPDISQPHHADYFSVIGYQTVNGFGPTEVSMVSEDWRKTPEGNWEIEQWIYALLLDGTLTRVMHQEVTETTEGRVLDSRDFPVGGPDDPVEQARWLNLLSQWYGFEG
jgi:hypothetical protein